MNRESLAKISGDPADSQNAVRVVLESRLDPPPHLLVSPLRSRHRVDGNEHDQRDNRDRCEKADEKLPHQNASPIDRCRVIRSSTPLRPDRTGRSRRLCSSSTRRLSPLMTLSVTTGSVSSSPGLIPKSTRIGPTGER